MSRRARVFVTGTGAICAGGRSASEILETAGAGVCAIRPIAQWDTQGWPVRVAGEVPGFNATALVADRKLHKLIRRSDLFGLYAADRAIEAGGWAAWREGLDEAAAALFSDRTGVYVGSGGGAYQNQYEYFPLMTEARGDLAVFGRELGATVNPMWLLRTLPNNVLCHVGIRHTLKGPNACITNHSAGGLLAVTEASAGLREGEADRAVAVGHDAPIEPQMVLYYHRLGLLASEAILPFDARRDGSLFGEGAAALVLETEAAVAARGAHVLAEVLGSGHTTEGEGLIAIRPDGEGLVRAMELAFAEAGLRPQDVGLIVAHANGTRVSDASEAAAIRAVFGNSIPPITGFKWSVGHLIAASGILDAVLAVHLLRDGRVPGIGNLGELDPALAPLPVSVSAQRARSDVALVLGRGFASTDAALLLRAAPQSRS